MRASLGAAALLVFLALPVSAQPASPAALRAAMLYGAEATGRVCVQGECHSPLQVWTASDAETAPLVLADTLRDPWLGRDKVLHAAGSFLLTLSAQYVLTSKLNVGDDDALPLAAGATLSLGLAKEVADSRRPVRPLFSTRDLAADALGVALAVAVILL